MPSSGRLFDWRWPQFLKDRAVKIGVGNNDLWGLHRTLTCRFLGQRKEAKQSRNMGKHIAGHMGLGCSHGSPRPTSPASFLAVKEGPAMGESCKCISIILGRYRVDNAFHLYIFEEDDLWSNQNTYTISPVPVGKTMKPGSFFFTALSRIMFHGLWPVSHLGWKQKSFSHPKDPALALNFCSADKACVVHTPMQTTPKKLDRLEACVWSFQIELVYWAALRSQSMWESPNTKKTS